VPNGIRATDAMKSMVRPAVTTPSVTQASRVALRISRNRGRTSTNKMTPAHASRSQAAPSGPTLSNSPTEAARPICTHSIDATAMPVPTRAAERWGESSVVVVMAPVNPRQSFVST
jgi:hypothetical protein